MIAPPNGSISRQKLRSGFGQSEMRSVYNIPERSQPLPLSYVWVFGHDWSISHFVVFIFRKRGIWLTSPEKKKKKNFTHTNQFLHNLFHFSYGCVFLHLPVQTGNAFIHSNLSVRNGSNSYFIFCDISKVGSKVCSTVRWRHSWSKWNKFSLSLQVLRCFSLPGSHTLLYFSHTHLIIYSQMFLLVLFLC